MNNEALNYAHSLFTNNGYKGTVDDFTNLLSTDSEAVSRVYSLFQNEGYKGSTDDFVNLFNQPEPQKEEKKKQKRGVTEESKEIKG